jgi:voltage-gated potassium channel
MRALLKQIVERRDTPAGRLFDLIIQILIVLSLISFSLDTVPSIQRNYGAVLRAAEVMFVALFTLEYLLRLVLADRKLGFVFSFLGLVDLLAILPFYLSAGIDLRSIRIIRVLRIFRTLKLLRYSQATRRIRRALRIAREELVLFLVTTALVLYLAAVGMYYFERDAQPEKFSSVIESLWWAITTLTTVGYGDAYPITAGGKLFTVLVLMIGLGIVAVPTGIFASALSRAREMADDGEATRSAPESPDADLTDQ